MFKMSRQPRTNATLLPFMTRHRAPFTCLKIGAGESPADQSIFVHEMVHHLQNLAGVKFECPAAREKAAYLAQDKWLARFGKSLENEFDVDMFTVVISSACM